jgi:ABC-type tungstate transport system permease subunit
MKHENKIFFLRMLHEFKKKEIPLEVFTVDDKRYLISEDYIELTEEGYMLTEKGLELLSKTPDAKVIVRYPLTKSGRVGDYNKVIESMSESAANALICAMVNSKFMKKIDTSNTRVFIQSLIDDKNYYKWGKDLIAKLHVELGNSLSFFLKEKKKKATNNV